MRYLFDNCISYRFARMLNALNVDVAALRDVFPANIPDRDFLGQLQAFDVYVTHDRRQRSREVEAYLIREAGITSLWLGPFWGKKQFWDQAKWLVHRWPLIDAFASSIVAGTCAEIQESGKAKVFNL